MLKALDGKKRYLIILVFCAETIAQMTGHGNIANVIKAVFAAIGWDASQGVVDAALVGQLVTAAWAIASGIRKDVAARREADARVSVPR